MEAQNDNDTSFQYFEKSLESLRLYLHDMDPLVVLFICGLSVVIFVLTCLATDILSPIRNWTYDWITGRWQQQLEVLHEEVQRQKEELKSNKEQHSREIAEHKQSFANARYFLEETKRKLEETKSRIVHVYLLAEINNTRVSKTGRSSVITVGLDNAKRELEETKRELEETKTRLSAIIGSRIKDNNPNIVNLGDEFRPTKLGEMSSELYDNEWTDAYSVLEKNNYSDTEAIQILLDIVMTTYQLCKTLTEEEWATVKDWIPYVHESVNVKQALREGQKAKAVKTMSDNQSKICELLTARCQDMTLCHLLSEPGPVQVYVETCVKLCLLMALHDPPLAWECSLWRPVTFCTNSQDANVDANETRQPEPKNGRDITYLQGEHKSNYVKFDTSLFKPFTAAGKYTQYIVWPAMLLHENGPIMRKGVAQGFK